MRKRKIPTLVGLFLVLAGVGVTVILVKKGGGIFPRAQSACLPENILVTNLSDNDFSIFWTTEENCSGSVIVKNESGENIYFDERDASAGGGLYKNHYVSVDGLEPEKTYKVKINSGRIKYGIKGSINKTCSSTLSAEADKEGLAVTTAYELSNLTIREGPINGTVFLDQNTAAEGAFVCVMIDNIAPLSAIVSGNGFWLVPLSGVLKNDLVTEADSLEDGLKEEIFVFYEGKKESYAINKTGNDNPVPEIYIGNEYNFETEGDLEKPTVTTAVRRSPTPKKTGKGFGIDKGEKWEITTPTGEVNDTLPVIRGRGEPGSSLEVIIESERMEGTARVDNNGNWSFVPPSNLSPGKHTITIEFIDKEGVLQTIKKSFVVLAKSPILPDETGTPSGRISPTITPIATATPTLAEATPELTATAVPTEVVYNGELMDTADDTPFIVILTGGILGATLGMVVILKKLKNKN